MMRTKNGVGARAIARVALCAIVAGMAIVIPSAAQAAVATFSLSQSSGTPGSTITASDASSNCAPNEVVTVSVLNPTGSPIASPVTTTADQSGIWTTNVTIPIEARTVGSVKIHASCSGATDGYADNVFGITPKLVPTSGTGLTIFTVNYYCVGLATVAVTTVGPNPTLFSSPSRTGTGDVQVLVTLGATTQTGTLRVVAGCNSTYGGYSGYSGYGGAGVVTFAPVFFTILPYPSSVSGTVTGDGQPLVGVLVNICPSFPASLAGCAQPLTDANGQYSVGLPAGIYIIGASPPVGTPFAGTLPSNLTIASGQALTRDFALPRTGTVTGHVTFTGGSPVPVAVGISDGLGLPRGTTTDAAGNYTFSSVRPSTYTVNFQPFGNFGHAVVTPVTVPPGETVTADVTLGPQTSLGGTVRGPGGAVVTGTIRVVACPAPFHMPDPFGSAFCPGAVTAFQSPFGSPGSYQIFGLGAGTWNVIAGDQVGLTKTISAEYQLALGAGQSLTGIDFTIGDVDNLSPGVEGQAPPPAGCASCAQGDGNGDGIADALQDNVASLPSQSPGNPYATIAVPAGELIADVVATDASSLPAPPPGAALPLGVLGFSVRNVPVGGAVDVTLFLPPGTNPTSYLKFQNGSWVDFTANTTLWSDHVVLHLVDGGAGDADHQANGVVVDPGAPAFALPVIDSVGPASIWLGVKNSDDVGTTFDVRAEVLKNGDVIGSGTALGLSSGGSGFNNAVIRQIAMTLATPSFVESGDQLSVRLAIRISCAAPGHASGTSRVWFGDAQAASNLVLAIDGTSRTYYLRNGAALAATPGPGPKQSSDTAVNGKQACPDRAYSTVGTWTTTLP